MRPQRGAHVLDPLRQRRSRPGEHDGLHDGRGPPDRSVYGARADADHDGYGDETQDKCVGTAGTFNGCPNTVTVNKLKQKGTKPKVKVKVTVPGAGTLEAGSASDPMLASSATKTSLKPVTETLTSTTKQHVVLILKLTKSAKRKLSEKGKLKAKVKVLYTPPGGPAGSQTGKVKLKS